MLVRDGGNYSWSRGVKYPIVIAEDTEFVLANFAQASPHTAGIFDVAPGVLLRLVGCNLVNVSVPDGAEIVGGNLAHVVPTETGDPARPTINLLHDCSLCASAWREINEGIEFGDLPKDASGTILHHEMKERYRARRDFEMLVEADVSDLQASNDAALAKWSK